MEIQHGIVTKIYPTDCAYGKAIIDDRIMKIGSSAAKELDIKEIVLPESIIELDSYAFLDCNKLEIINLPAGLQRIGERAFSGCKSLKKIIIPNGITTIEASTFNGCESLEEIVLPTTIKEINYRAFADCKNLKRITIPDGVTKIDRGVFSGCENLEEIAIPESIKNLGYQIFLNCKKLKNVSLPKTMTSLPDETFMGCTSLENIDLPETITSIGNSAFNGCKKLRSFPTNVSFFGESAFKNCRNLDNIVINSETKSLPSSIFEGCIKLSNISCDNSIPIGEKAFRSCINLTVIPSFVSNYDKYSFENCISLTEAIALYGNIPEGAFRGCKKLKKVHNSDSVFSIGASAFSGCENLEIFSCSDLLSQIYANTFEGCKNLTSFIIPNGVTSIGNKAFYGCEKLTEFVLPACLKSIGTEALKYCHSIQKINIPTSFEKIGNQAFSYMNSLSHIDVDSKNSLYITPDNLILIDIKRQTLVLYANGSDNKHYDLENYCLFLDFANRETINPIQQIDKFAFAGSNNLESLSICSCTEDIEYTAFNDCNNLKTLTIKRLPLYSMHGIRFRDNGNHFFNSKEKQAYIPFENVIIDDKLLGIQTNAFAGFKNLKNVHIGNDELQTIYQGAFSDCKNLENVFIPACVCSIPDKTFADETLITFENGLQLYGKEFKGLEKRDGVKIYSTKDGKHYIESDQHIILITDREIKDLFSNPDKLTSSPELALKQLELMAFYEQNDPLLRDGAVISHFTKKPFKVAKIMNIGTDKPQSVIPQIADLKHLIDHIRTITPISSYQKQDDTELLSEIPLEQLENPQKLINHLQLMNLMSIRNIDPSNGIFIPTLEIDFDEILIKEFDDYSRKVLDQSGIKEKDSESPILKKVLDNPQRTIEFINLLRKYNIKNNFLAKGIFIAALSIEEMEQFIKTFDANMKRMIELSGVLNNQDTAIDNMRDLLKLAKVLGAFEDDPIIKQRAITFINDRIFTGEIEENITKYKITGDDIHRKFNELKPRDEFDSEFAKFFMKNYKLLCDKESLHSGFICRAYNNFVEIAKTSTSDKGLQKHLLVTFEKCVHYLATHKFNGVTKETEELAQLLGYWFDQDAAFQTGIAISNESLSAPRNIFTKFRIDENKELIFDNSNEHDLKEEVNDNFSFEWLPKQDLRNLLLGKFCNCCAHINGAGAGIMRASMITSDHQNLIIRNNLGEIIGKSTIYVNRHGGYAVFNNIESSSNYRSDEDKEKIYNAFMRGAKALLDKFNENNPNNPLTRMTIGTSRNTVGEFFVKNEDQHPLSGILEHPKYGDWALNEYGNYVGDATTQQRFVLKR